ncbi:MAG: NUDIX domain-containing protein [Vicingaceae bacterium]
MQKYQVFIKEHALCFAEKVEKYEQSVSVMFIKNPSLVIFQAVVDWLLKEVEHSMCIHFICKDSQKVWQEFQNTFTQIQAAGGRVRNQKGEMLWIKRLGKWDLPKGKVEAEESIEEAAVREVEEECGLEGLLVLEKLPSTYHIYTLGEKIILKQTHWYEMETASENVLKPQAEEDIEEALWLKTKEVKKALRETYPSIRSLF